MFILSEVTDPVTLSDAAVKKLISLRQDESNPDIKFRVYITGGGCAGFSYGFKFDEETSPEDTLVEKGGMQMLVDALSVQYLEGSEVDYTEGLQGARFVINNPNAVSTCGCGSSFSV